MSRAPLVEPAVLPSMESLECRYFLSGAGAVDAPEGGGAAADLQAVVAENNAFAFDLYQRLCGNAGSLFFSPLSISAALAMTYAGAAGETARQMADVFHWALPGDRLHPAFGDLIARLLGTGASASQGQDADKFVFDIANQLWGQSNYQFCEEFLSTLAESYHAPLVRHDFRVSPESAEAGRQIINDWVSDKTHERIKDLLQPPDISTITRLVLVNAIYMNAEWQYAFDEQATYAQTFHLPGENLAVEMMHQTEELRYAEGDGYQVLELPYAGSTLAMDIFLPSAGGFGAFEEGLTADTADAILDGLGTRNVRVSLPKFSVGQETELSELLKSMGMPDAFDPDAADFSGIHDSRLDGEVISIGVVRHKAWIAVKEDGTEAAAATGIGGTGGNAYHPSPPPPVPFKADRPFIYMIRDRATDSTLFMGRVSDATALTVTDQTPCDGSDSPALGPPGFPVFVQVPLDWESLPPAQLPPSDRPVPIVGGPKVKVTAPPQGVLLKAVRGPSLVLLPPPAATGDADAPPSSAAAPAPAMRAGPAAVRTGAKAPLMLVGGSQRPVAFAFGGEATQRDGAAESATLQPVDLTQIQALFVIRA